MAETGCIDQLYPAEPIADGLLPSKSIHPLRTELVTLLQVQLKFISVKMSNRCVSSMVRSGIIWLATGDLNQPGASGYLWTMAAFPTSEYARNFAFNNVVVSISGRIARWLGLPLRCLAD